MTRISGYQLAVMFVACIAMTSPAWSEGKKADPAANRVAVVNGVPLERDDFDKEVFLVQKTLLGQGKPLTCSQVTSIRAEVLESMIRREVLYQDSRKAGVKPDENAVASELAALKRQFPTEAEYKNELGRRNMSEEALRSQLERNSVLQQYVDRQFGAKVTVTDAEMVSYYESHLDLFKQPLQARVSHILIQVDPKWDDLRKQEARRKAEQVLKNLRNGQDFAALAREQSDGPTRTSGGDLGYIRTGQLDGQLDNAVFKLKAGETSEIIETSYGFHLFKVFDRKPETILAYDAVKEQIRKHLAQEKARQDADQYAKNLREKASVEILLREEVSTAKMP
ncbi:MAG TPA: peptidylprolyl isomerase [Nitrospirota bacterium]|nr:peptidylprolyl isomerase [Nitrospirota bacterium]